MNSSKLALPLCLGLQFLCNSQSPAAAKYLDADNYLEDISSCRPEVTCDSSSKFRPNSGICNNVENPYWGATNYSYLRLEPPAYSDGSDYRVGSDKKPLPLPRTLTETLLPEIGNSPSRSRPLSGAFIFFAQIISHDMISTGFSPAIGCCDKGKLPPEPKKEGCDPMPISKRDPFYSRYDVTCMTYSHVFTVFNLTNIQKCLTKIRQPAGAVTSYIDLSMIYGEDVSLEPMVRSYDGGKLNFNIAPDGSVMAPTSNVPLNDFCRIKSKDQRCVKGDIRLNQNPALVALTILLSLEHNRIADSLLKINPNWDDETTYQEARRISIAQFQHITYNEVLPVLLDDDVRKSLDLDPLADGYTKYNPKLNAAVFNSFVGSIWRSLHSMLPGDLFNLKTKSNCPLSNNPKGRFPWFASGDLGIDCFKELTTYYLTSTSNIYGAHTSNQFRDYFQPGDRKYGDDLSATDVNRGRDHGVAPFNEIRKLCGLKPFSSFKEFAKHSSKPATVMAASKLYSSINDVDLYIGALLEKPKVAGMMGPTAQCIFSQQFARTKFGDRFYYEHGDQSNSFTSDQLKSIKKSSYSSMVCNNLDSVNKIQKRSMEAVSKSNPLVPCDKIGQIDLSLWKEKQS